MRKHPAIGIMILSLWTAACVSHPPSPSTVAAATVPARPFPIVETTIDGIHAAFRDGSLTCRTLVETYLARIAKYDQPAGLNALVVLNPKALAVADELDAEFKKTGTLRPLHGIPVIVKDNYETLDLQTSGGSIALKGFIPAQDAFQVRRLREAGAVILAKSNMGEWAFSPLETVSSIAGVTRNPYDLEYVPAGSSGGTAAAVAANLGAVGMGTDTGNSIRGPSSHCALVGFRPTLGLTSRAGIIPLYLRNDVGGPMTRTVRDAVRILDVTAGYDPADPVTQTAEGRTWKSYAAFLDPRGLNGARIGVFRRFTDAPTADAEVKALWENALRDLRAGGAVLVDPFEIPDFEALSKDIWCDMFRHDVDGWLAAQGGRAPYRDLRSIFAAGLFVPENKGRISRALEATASSKPCGDIYEEPKNIAFREAILKAMDLSRVDVIVYPTWSNPPRKIGDFQSPAGDNSQLIPPHTGFPGISVPMGFTRGRLPAGLQIVGRLFSEPTVIKVAFAYEQATRHRRPPEKFK
jgi:amidase